MGGSDPSYLSRAGNKALAKTEEMYFSNLFKPTHPFRCMIGSFKMTYPEKKYIRIQHIKNDLKIN